MGRYKYIRDEELVALAKDGDEEAQEVLFGKYKTLVKAKTRPYFIAGADQEDIVQEGMIGLYKAVRDFDGERNISFYHFAELCVTRQILTAVKLSLRQKHVPLNTSVSLNGGTGDEEKGFFDLLSDVKVQSPEEVFFDRESIGDIEGKLEEVLSELELKVLKLYLEGKSYVEIGEALGRDEKSVGNSLQRVRRKMVGVLRICDVGKL